MGCFARVNCRAKRTVFTTARRVCCASCCRERGYAVALLIWHFQPWHFQPPISNRYKTLSELSVGGMGEVYLAHDPQLNRNVALKVLPADLTNDQDCLNRFTQEAQAASALNHPNIVTIYEIGSEGQTHFIAMEFIEGETLRRKLHRTRFEIE